MPVRRGPNPVPDEESIFSPPGNCEGFIFSREGKHNSLKGEKTCGGVGAGEATTIVIPRQCPDPLVVPGHQARPLLGRIQGRGFLFVVARG